VAVRGDPPSPLRLPPGCRFHPRCPIAQDLCRQDDPALTAGPDLDAGHDRLAAHSAACHFAWAAPAIQISLSGGEADQ
jgi:oligopeptide/dipeptide ABC transporter ATP-binding protein